VPVAAAGWSRHAGAMLGVGVADSGPPPGMVPDDPHTDEDTVAVDVAPAACVLAHTTLASRTVLVSGFSARLQDAAESVLTHGMGGLGSVFSISMHRVSSGDTGMVALLTFASHEKICVQRAVASSGQLHVEHATLRVEEVCWQTWRPCRERASPQQPACLRACIHAGYMLTRRPPRCAGGAAA
jgi:hypothetical protein